MSKIKLIFVTFLLLPIIWFSMVGIKKAIYIIIYFLFSGLLIFVKPESLFLGTFLSIINYNSNFILSKNSIVNFSLPLSLIAVFAMRFKSKRMFFLKLSVTDILIFLFLIYANFVNFLFSYRMEITKVLLNIAFFSIATVVMRKFILTKEWNKIFLYYILAVVITSIYYFIKYVSFYGADVFKSPIFRFSAGNADPNVFGRFVIISIAMILTVNLPSIKRVLKVIFILLLIFVGMLTYSKMFSIILVIIFFIAGLKVGRTNKYFLFVFLLISLSFSVLVVLFITKVKGSLEIPILGPLYARFFMGGTTTSLLSFRNIIWEASWKALEEKNVIDFLIGGGYNYSRYLLWEKLGVIISTHNCFLQVLLDYGIVGFLIFMGIILTNIKKINLVELAYLLTIFSLAWIFDWSMLMFFVLWGNKNLPSRMEKNECKQDITCG